MTTTKPTRAEIKDNPDQSWRKPDIQITVEARKLRLTDIPIKHENTVIRAIMLGNRAVIVFFMDGTREAFRPPWRGVNVWRSPDVP